MYILFYSIRFYDLVIQESFLLLLGFFVPIQGPQQLLPSAHVTHRRL